MLSKLTLALGLAGLASALSGTANARGRCGAPAPSDAQMQAAAEFTENEGDMAGDAFRAGMVTVNTYFHVVASSDSVEDGYLSVSLTSLPCPQLQTPSSPREEKEERGDVEKKQSLTERRTR